ncbi:iron ABC transporter permease [Niallia sp. NCCP-28]|uniref:FecCD family ABC transporter permease n=1 Tax=Niallia sp. NCCP-28 TaxID=2934712 RepID=UPI00208CF1FE|nr:iron ABC transporter permease [Niallia sp. NCCP-28]GKU84541.1 iron(3+)-hydroxamate import system permease protein FhuG [Niallia sp. NCCP-28]
MATKKHSTQKFIGITLIFVFLLFILFFVSLNMGLVKIAPNAVLQTLIGNGTERDKLVLLEFRLPRMVLAIMIGAGLAFSGSILQVISKNELADPGIIGINAGAGFAVVLFIFVVQGSMSGLAAINLWLLPLFSFLGAVLAAAIIYILAWKKGINPIRLVLVGIGVNSGFAAAIAIMQFKMNPQDFMKAAVWISGDIWGASWNFVMVILPWMVLLVIYALYKSHTLNQLSLGDQVATGLGVQLERERLKVLFAAVAIAGLCVSAGGGISFLGLVAPHIARKIMGPKHQYVLPFSALIGAFVLLLADTIGQNALAPTQISVGIVVAILSAPYFIYLLMKTN